MSPSFDSLRARRVYEELRARCGGGGAAASSSGTAGSRSFASAFLPYLRTDLAFLVSAQVGRGCCKIISSFNSTPPLPARLCPSPVSSTGASGSRSTWSRARSTTGAPQSRSGAYRMVRRAGAALNAAGPTVASLPCADLDYDETAELDEEAAAAATPPQSPTPSPSSAEAAAAVDGAAMSDGGDADTGEYSSFMGTTAPNCP